MDLIPILLKGLLPLWWVLPLVIIASLIKTPKVKGMIGEALVKIVSKIKLPKELYHPIHNVTLKTPDGTTQIDHIFVSTYGIFVVETKNMKGWIFGSEKQAVWTQKIYKKSYKFQNPLRQNYKHVKTLEAVLDIPKEAIHSVIVFTGEGVLKTPMPVNVTRGVGYISYIKSFDQSLFTAEQVAKIVEKIENERLKPSRAIDRQHVRQLKARLEQAESQKG